MAAKPEFRLQKGPQELFLSTSADIAIYGGAAGGGKTYALLIEPIRHISNKAFGGIIFRRTTPQIRAEGSLWDTSFDLYPHAGAIPKEHVLEWDFPSGARLSMKHLEHDKTVYDHQGAQYTFIGFDELTHFTEKQFFYLMSRNRSTSGIAPYIRATTNPDRDSWVRGFVDWWIDKDGYPIPKRSGILRYFTRIDGNIVWVDKDWKASDGSGPKSLTFIPAKLEDNPALLDKDPGYRSNLEALPRADRMRLKEGNWNVSELGGMFEESWFQIKDHDPDMIMFRYWDRAATAKIEGNNPDWTAGALCGINKEGLWIVDINHFQGSSAENEKRIQAQAKVDGLDLEIGIEQEPGSAGKDVSFHYQQTVLKGYIVRVDPPTGDKIVRCKPWAAWAEQKKVFLKRGPWNRAFLDEAISFPNGKKDQIDAVSGAFKFLTQMDTTEALSIQY